MRLLRLRLRHVGPFHDGTIRFDDAIDPREEDTAEIEAEAPDAPPRRDDDPPATSAAPALVTASPRTTTVLFGGDGTGKTSILSALALTRPGHALPPVPASGATREPRTEPAWVAADWLLGEDDPERPHPLVVASPNAVLPGETQEAVLARRREQAVFDRRAQQEGGHVFVSFSGARWFSRTPNMLSMPERSLLRYDVRQPSLSFDDPTRADLARETKQVLSFASIGSALAAGRAEFASLARFEAALREVVDVVLEPFDLRYAGVSPTTLEPQARSAHGGLVPFDALPRAARHLVAFVALPLRALVAAYPGAEFPREREGVVAIDDAESQQDPALLRDFVPLLRRALPSVQWILTTSSTQLALACDSKEVLALRRTASAQVEIGEGLLH